ncbi:MAG: hypothetical protein HKP37_12205 [Boseongicola sp.]|nr:hypothetical protein [Boseongicola sp.]NNL19495.1 hypothetical protein [Boseongicola sp.]
MPRIVTNSLAALFFSFAAPLGGFADDASIENVTARASGSDWSFSVTLLHGDTGWDDYADGWRVVAEDGTVLGTRTLFHPHVNEQPFTRSLSGVEIPDGVKRVYIEARTNTDGWGAARLEVELPE